MGRTACTEPQCLYKGALYLYLYTQTHYAVMHHPAMTGIYMCNKFCNALSGNYKIIEIFHLCAIFFFVLLL